jgi:predicted  nucleic acid-binding Zn-ribbon protein
MDQLTTEPTEFDNVADTPLSFSGTPAIAGLASSALLGRQVSTGDDSHSDSQHSDTGIEFRVTRAGTPARRLRIHSARCTLGSGAGCTVRLSDSDLRPLHAVVIREHGRILIRGYSIPVEVNGEATQESELNLGDVFRLGEYCFEMIDLPAGATGDERSDHGSNVPVEGFAKPRNVDRSGAVASEAPEASSHSPFSKRLSFVSSQPPTGQPKLGPAPQAARKDSHSESGSSLAQVHAQAKRHSELLAALQAAQDQERRTADQLAAAIKRCAHADSRADEAQENIRRLSDQIARLDSHIRSLNDSAKTEETRLTGETARLNETIQSLRKAESEAIRQRDEVTRQRDEALASRAAAIEGGANSRRELEAARSQIADLTQQLRGTSEQLQEKSNRLDSATELAEQLQNRVEQLQELCQTQSRQLSAWDEAQKSAPQADDVALAKMEDEVAFLRAELDAVSKKLSRAEADQSRAEALQATLDAAMAEQLAQKLSWEGRIAELQEKIGELSADLVQAAEELIRSRDEAAETREQLDQLLVALNEVREELAARPTVQQWDDLNQKLSDAYEELKNKEELVAAISDESKPLDAVNARPDSDEPEATADAPQSVEDDPLSSVREQLRNVISDLETQQSPIGDQGLSLPSADHSHESDSIRAESDDMTDVFGGDSAPSIDDYMANLLRRMGQDSPASEATSLRGDEPEVPMALKAVQDHGQSEESDMSADFRVSDSNGSRGTTAESRKRDFDERALRDALAYPPDAEPVDPNADYDGAPQYEIVDIQESGAAHSPPSNVDYGDEDSVEAYMARLLQRMGGDPDSSPDNAADDDSAAKIQAQAPVRRTPRGAPERQVSMDAMRELANANADSVLSVSSIKGAKDLQSKAFYDLVQSGVILLAALAFFYCAFVNPSLRLVWMTAGMLAIGLAVFFLYEMFRKLTVASVSEKSAKAQSRQSF